MAPAVCLTSSEEIGYQLTSQCEVVPECSARRIRAMFMVEWLVLFCAVISMRVVKSQQALLIFILKDQRV
jgi:hypothetical protein